MSRPPRPDLAGVPQHVVQRGNNRLPCFLDDDDRQFYLHGLRKGLSGHDCALHAYALMDNHVHLLLTPGVPGAVSRLMQTFGRNYAARFNARHGRTGTLWEGRYKSCLVDSEYYVLACYRYIELNPVRAGLVQDPGGYAWSSYCTNGLGVPNELIAPHPAFMGLAMDALARGAAYRELVREGMSDEVLSEIRTFLKQRGALGSEAFRRQVESKLQRFAGVRPAHRPRKPVLREQSE